jgi:protein involved in polysaccharide export with SLBB domain
MQAPEQRPPSRKQQRRADLMTELEAYQAAGGVLLTAEELAEQAKQYQQDQEQADTV